MKPLTIVLLFGIISALLFVACGDGVQVKRNALGTPNQINVICDDQLWLGPVGDTLRYYLESPFPMLPQPEPMFKLRHLTTEALLSDPLRRELRTYLFLGQSDIIPSPTNDLIRSDMGSRIDSTSANFIGHDKWATDQLLIYLYAQDKPALTQAIRSYFTSIAQKVNRHDQTLIHSAVYAPGVERTIQNKIQARYNADLDIPSDYAIAHEDNRTLWLRKEFNDVLYNIVLYRRPYRDTTELRQASLVELRDSIGAYLISSTTEGSYMRTNMVDLPIYANTTTIGGQYASTIRGVWEMEGDFLGGPFFSYSILYPDQKQMLFIDAFVFAPQGEKKIHMQYLDHIVSTLSFKK